MNTVVGIDIGTTSISINIIKQDDGSVIKSITLLNDSVMHSATKFSDLQDPDVIYHIVESKLSEIINEYTVLVVGFTGQMHGIVYIDEFGNAVSPLYTWKDASGNQICENGKNYCTVLSELSGYQMASGYGLSTLFYHTRNCLIPAKAKKICTIQDYVILKLTNKNQPILHTSNAASLGIFNYFSMNFDYEACTRAGIDVSFLPVVTKDNEVIGTYKNIPLAVAIGDNQASFLGSVRDMENSVLINIGTGSQISFVSGKDKLSCSMEKRPLVDDYIISAGSSLCGGRALAVLENFFRSIAKTVANENVTSAYPGIDRYIASIISNSSHYTDNQNLNISTKFCGTRVNPQERGYIENISIENFTPENMIVGFLSGIINELWEMYEMKDHKHTVLVGSGNGLRKNILLRKIAEERFGMKINIPVHNEEAAYGSGLFALVCSGLCENIYEAQKLIAYEK